MRKAIHRARRPGATFGAAALLCLACGAVAQDAFPDPVFDDGYDDVVVQDDPYACVPEAPLYPPYEYQGGPTELTDLWAPDPIGASLVQLRVAGNMWEAYAFRRADLPAAMVEFNADTSNVGDRAFGADLRVVVISACAGDFRPPAQPACGALVGEGSFLYVNFGAPVANVCNLDPARTWYFNVHVGPAPCNLARGTNNCAFRIMVLPRGEGAG